jgi:hypothetical protein
MKSSFHSLIPFLPLFCNRQLSSIPLLPSWYPGRLAPRNSTRLLKWTLLYNHCAQTTQKTQPVYCWEGVFTTPLRSNGSYWIFTCVFVAAGICLPNHYLAMNVYSDFPIPAFGRHITIFNWKGQAKKWSWSVITYFSRIWIKWTERDRVPHLG